MAKKKVKQKYDFKVGAWKTGKNFLVFAVPTFVASLAGVTGKWSWLAGLVAYGLKNWYETTEGKKLL